MKIRAEWEFIIGAVVSFLTIIALYSDELERRLGAYFIAYAIVWALTALVLLAAALKFMRPFSTLRIILVSVGVGYLSVVTSYVLVVLFDVSSISGNGARFSINEMIIPLVYPLVVLKGWVFCILPALYVFVLRHMRLKQ